MSFADRDPALYCNHITRFDTLHFDLSEECNIQFARRFDLSEECNIFSLPDVGLTFYWEWSKYKKKVIFAMIRCVQQQMII